jgi:hypothetical protein
MVSATYDLSDAAARVRGRRPGATPASCCCPAGVTTVSADLLLGVDVGTGATKAALYDAAGRLRGSASVPTRLHRRWPRRGRAGPAEMEQEVHAAIRGALADAARGRTTSPRWRSTARWRA